MSWLAYQLTDSALFLGVVAFFSSISFLLFRNRAGREPPAWFPVHLRDCKSAHVHR